MSLLAIFNITILLVNLIGAAFFLKNFHSVLGWLCAIVWCVGFYMLKGQVQ